MKTENLKCHRCGHQLEVKDVQNFDEERGQYTFLHCPHCGADYEIDEPLDEEKKDYPFWKDEDTDGRLEGIDIMNGHCLNCGHKIYVGSNFMLSDYDPEHIKDIDDDKMNFCMNTCENCGCTEVRWDNSENEKKDYPYWKEDNDLYEQLKDRTLEYIVHVWAKVNGTKFAEVEKKLDDIKGYFNTLVQLENSHK